MTTTDTGTQLLAAILANPGDDTLRLAYADWLEETDDGRRVPCKRCNGTGGRVIDGSAWTRFTCPTCDGTGTVRDERRARRAELIRVQCELETLLATQHERDAPCPENARIAVLNRRIRPIIKAHGQEWARVECPTCRGPREKWATKHYPCDDCGGTGDAMHNRNPQWSRGFVAQVECRLSEVGGEVDCDASIDPKRGIRVGRPGEGRAMVFDRSLQHVDCKRCNGTGRVFRPAPWLDAAFLSHPTIERVVLTDREPLVVGATLIMHEWHRATWDAALRGEPDYVPDAIFSKLRGFTGTSASHNSLAVRYHTHAAARDALAVAVADVVRAAVKGGGS